MSRLRKVALGLAIGLGALVAVPVCLIGTAFVGNEPLADGHTFAEGRIVTIVDGYVACFLVDVGGGEWALIDVCMDPSAAPIQAALAERGAELGDVRTVLLTHSHSDHIGGLGALKHAEIRALAESAPLLAGEAAHEGPIPSLAGAVDSGARLSAPVVDADKLRVGDTTFEVFAVPGHTADSAAFLAHGVLFIGDNGTYKSAGELVIAPWIFSDDTDANRASMQALSRRLAQRAADVSWIAPAHTGPVEGLAALAAM